MFDLRVKNANIVTSQRVISGEIYVKDGKIAAITAPNTDLPATQTLDAAFRAVLPGVIDPHVHAGHGKSFLGEQCRHGQAHVAQPDHRDLRAAILNLLMQLRNGHD